MRSRIEEKISLHKFELIKIRKWILSLNGEKIYNKRKISSIYFDNSNYSMFSDSEEGICPRSKLRIRSYDDKKIFFLEKKISNQNFRLKKNQEISESKFIYFLKRGLIEKNYGICRPKIIVSYIREYYMLKNIRITIDVDIRYSLFNSKITKFDKSNVMELKTDQIFKKDFINNFFYFKRTRFSKYCRGLQLLLN